MWLIMNKIQIIYCLRDGENCTQMLSKGKENQICCQMLSDVSRKSEAISVKDKMLYML